MTEPTCCDEPMIGSYGLWCAMCGHYYPVPPVYIARFATESNSPEIPDSSKGDE